MAFLGSDQNAEEEREWKRYLARRKKKERKKNNRKFGSIKMVN